MLINKHQNIDLIIWLINMGVKVNTALVRMNNASAKA